MKNCMSKICRTLGLLLSVVLLASGALSQEQPSRVPTTRRDGMVSESGTRGGARAGVDVIMASDEDYRLAPSDVIKIVIEDAPELSSSYRINKAGTIPMKYLGTMSVVGKTPEEVSVIITDGLKGRYLKDPKVYVAVEQYNSRTFFIQGAVRSPGVFVIEGKPSLFKLISIAGGMADNHGSTAYIIRETKLNAEKLEKLRSGQDPADDKSKETIGSSTPLGQAVEATKGSVTGIEGESEYELIRAQINGLYRGAFDQNLIIQPNDLVYIPPSDVFFVAGEVKAPGQFPLRDGTTLRQAISLAQGTFFKSATNRAVIFRQDPLTGKLNEIPVDVGAVMSGKAQDVLISANDVIMVPNSKVKSFTGTFMTALANATAFSVIPRR